MNKFIELGVIQKPHGFRGAFLASIPLGAESALSYLNDVALGDDPEEVVKYTVEEASWMPKGWKIKLKGIESDKELGGLIGKRLFAAKEHLAPSKKDEFYVGDLIGFEGRMLGHSESFGKFIGVEPGISPTEHTSPDRWTFSGESRIEIPATKRFIDHIDLGARVIWFKTLPST